MSLAGDEQFRVLADNAPVMIWRAGADKLCDYFNKPWLDFTGRTLAEELGNGWIAGVHAEDYARCLDIYVTAFDRRESFTMDYRLRRHDGEYRWVLDNGRPFFRADGTFAGYFGSCIDITERKEIETRAETTLRELHHRIRNSLQLAISMLNLQSARNQDEACAVPLLVATARVLSIGLAQRFLERGNSCFEVAFDSYLDSLAVSLRDRLDRDDINLAVALEPLSVSVDQAVPLGLLVNELLLNSFLHGLSDRRAGTIRLSGRRNGDRDYEVAVEDDGIGLAADRFAIATRHPSSLGFQLVRSMAEQAGATVTLRDGNGTSFNILFSPQRR